jgi:hypothetical protein
MLIQIIRTLILTQMTQALNLNLNFWGLEVIEPKAPNDVEPNFDRPTAPNPNSEPNPNDDNS